MENGQRRTFGDILQHGTHFQTLSCSFISKCVTFEISVTCYLNINYAHFTMDKVGNIRKESIVGDK